MPSPKAQIRIPLDIPNVDVQSMRINHHGYYIITVESRAEIIKCGLCNQTIKCNYGHGERIRLRHLPILGQKTYIELYPKRGQCPTCLHGPTTTQILSWYRQRSGQTDAYEKYLMKQLIGSSVADVSVKEQVSYDVVVGILQRQIRAVVDWGKIDNLGTIGIDEVATKKGHKGYKAIITARQDDGTVHILGVLNDRKKTV